MLKTYVVTTSHINGNRNQLHFQAQDITAAKRRATRFARSRAYRGEGWHWIHPSNNPRGFFEKRMETVLARLQEVKAGEPITLNGRDANGNFITDLLPSPI